MNELTTSEISDSILFSIKKLIGISKDDDSFDLDIILNINSACSTLYQLGVIDKPYTVTIENNDTYEDLIPSGKEDAINNIKMYFYYKTKLGFDSSTLSTTVIDVIKNEIKELEWRLMTSFNPEEPYDE